MNRVVIAFAVLASVWGGTVTSAQDTVCLGHNCDPSVNTALPDIYDTYTKLGLINGFNARQTFGSLGLGDDETREQCIARCQQEFVSWLSACASVYGPADANEDVAVSTGRLNCAAEGERRQKDCLAPVSFAECS